MVITTWTKRYSFVWGNPAKARELPWYEFVIATFIVAVQDIAVACRSHC